MICITIKNQNDGGGGAVMGKWCNWCAAEHSVTPVTQTIAANQLTKAAQTKLWISFKDLTSNLAKLMRFFRDVSEISEQTLSEAETAGTQWGCNQAPKTDTICVRQSHAGTTCSILETEIEQLKRQWSRTWFSLEETERTWDRLRIIFLRRWKCCYKSFHFPLFKVCNK